jgi:phosphoenolpyruvate synthase/pyruvate phosphate dikinase
MKKKYFEVKIFYSSFCTYEIEAKNENEAIIKARNLPMNNNEILSNLENWKEADIAKKNNYEKD